MFGKTSHNAQRLRKHIFTWLVITIIVVHNFLYVSIREANKNQDLGWEPEQLRLQVSPAAAETQLNFKTIMHRVNDNVQLQQSTVFICISKINLWDTNFVHWCKLTSMNDPQISQDSTRSPTLHMLCHSFICLRQPLPHAEALLKALWQWRHVFLSTCLACLQIH